MQPTPLHRLADELLGDDGPLTDFVAARRATDRSWRLIARDLFDSTDGKVDVTAESLRTWCSQPAAAS